MAHPIDIGKAQNIIGYRFNQEHLLSEALQAAVRVQDRESGATIHWHDGNRRLAQLGQKVLEVALLGIHYERGNKRETANAALVKLASSGYLAEIALKSGLDMCTTISERQSNQVTPTTTLKLTVTAVIGAVWLDSDKSIESVQAVMQNLRIMLDADEMLI